MQIFLLEKGLAYQFTKVHYPEGYFEIRKDKYNDPKDKEWIKEVSQKIRIETYRMNMTLLGANSNCEISTDGRSTDYTNFYNNNALNVHSYMKVTYHNVYPSIEWTIYINEGKIKYDFVVHPRTDPPLIKMEFTNQESLKLKQDGGFMLKNKLGSISEKQLELFTQS